jgi:hypothetical protein
VGPEYIPHVMMMKNGSQTLTWFLCLLALPLKGETIE